jgi:DNA (cytosine-5)-methyltransferase 1
MGDKCMHYEEFKKWLMQKNKYTDASIKDILSRLRRANNILTFQNDDIYLFKLNQCEEFQKISVFVKSQIRRSVRLYFQYLNEMETA